MERHQIDLVSFEKNSVENDGQHYSYVYASSIEIECDDNIEDNTDGNIVVEDDYNADSNDGDMSLQERKSGSKSIFQVVSIYSFCDKIVMYKISPALLFFFVIFHNPLVPDKLLETLPMQWIRGTYEIVTWV